MSKSAFKTKRVASKLRVIGLGFRTFWYQLWTGHPGQQLQHIVKAQLGSKAVAGHALHPCLIAGQLTLVHAPDLKTRDSEFFGQLSLFAQEHGYHLLADRRHEDCVVSHERRSKSLPVLFLSMGLGAASAVADQPSTTGQTLALFGSQLELLNTTVKSTDSQFIDAADPDVQAVIDKAGEDDEHAALTHELASILLQHYQADETSPDYVLEDLWAMADYFSRYPEATELLRSLQGRAWQLHYAKDSFETQVRGNPLQVKGVTVSFDTRAAAQLRSHKACEVNPGACIASPADALLHELLHAQSALIDSQEFIAQGGLNSVIYPFEHESAVIYKENMLYRAMSEADGRYRPHRHAHTGRVIASACVTCLD